MNMSVEKHEKKIPERRKIESRMIRQATNFPTIGRIEEKSSKHWNNLFQALENVFFAPLR